MFSLRKRSSDRSSLEDNEFGWWLEKCCRCQQLPEEYSQPVMSIPSYRNCQKPEDNSETAENEEDFSANDGDYTSNDSTARGYCYTPERLILSEDYRIVAPSPRIDPNGQLPSARSFMIAMQSLEADEGSGDESAPIRDLIKGDSDESLCQLEASTGQQENWDDIFDEVKNFTCSNIETCQCQDWSFDDEACCTAVLKAGPTRSESQKFQANKANLLPPTLFYLVDAQYSQFSYLDCDTIYTSANSLYDDCAFENALSVKGNSETESSVERLQCKLDDLHDSHRSIAAEISILKRDFMIYEWRISHISKDARKLRNEFNQINYLDDLLKLLQGDVEDISSRHWPFLLKNSNFDVENVNLIV